MQKKTTFKIQKPVYKSLFHSILILCFLGLSQQVQSQDMGVVSLVAPVSPICAANNQTIVVSLKNFDVATIDYSVDSVIVTVEISGASTQTFNDTLYTGTVVSDSVYEHTVTSACDLSASGTHIFKVYTTILSGDLSALNDTLSPISIAVNPSPVTPTVTAYGSVSFCVGDSVLLVSSSATGILWSDSDSTTNDSIVVYITGNYSVTETSGGCSSTSLITSVTANPFPAVPTITVYDSTVFCIGDTAILVSSSATGNLWSDGSTNDSITVTTSDSITVTVTTAGCSTTSDTTIITANPYPAIPTITTSDTVVFCMGESIILFSSSPTGNSWTGGGMDDSLIVTAAGSYSVTVTINGCSSMSADTTVTVNPLPTVSLAPFTTIPCSSDPAFALTGGLPAGGTYSGIGVDSGLFYPGSAGAIQGITYTYVDSNGCLNSASSNITVVYCTGIEEFVSEGFNLYPNPSMNGIVNISIKNTNFFELLISVTDIQGKEVYNSLEKNISSDFNKQINLMHLAKGIYYIKLSNDTNVKTQKLILE